MNAAQIVQMVVALLGAGGIIGGIVALMKLRPESGAIVVTAAQGALVVQSSVLNELHKENERLRSRVSALETLQPENQRLRDQLADMEQQLAEMKRQLAALRDEVHEDKA
ncbi:MAG TPA: hypothetical protein VF062_26895 [Candidatus Limnocylindrales bacterium]